MGLLDNGLSGNAVTGLAMGIGAAVLGPMVLPALAGVAKPLLKEAIKGGLMLYELRLKRKWRMSMRKPLLSRLQVERPSG